MKYSDKEKELILSYSKEIVCRLSIMLRDIEEFNNPREGFMVMSGRLTDIFDDYRRLHAVALRYKEISNENLIKLMSI